MVQKAQSLEELLEAAPKNQIIGDNLIRAWSKINSSKYKNILCAISGGSDSDVMLDIIYRCDKDNKVTYVWYDTGLEYQATKDHIQYLKDAYEINIEVVKALKPIPLVCKHYGQPFVSKRVSDYLSRLQKHDFQWEDETFDILYKKYPKCKGALKWWCNANGENSSFNIERNKYLKEFIIQNPPTFPISCTCCEYAKKKPAKKYINEHAYDLNIIGVRKAEGGTRATAYKNCFTENANEHDEYRPLFWYKDSDKRDYEIAYAIEHSKCYTEYGLKRTGCVGCPFGRDFEFELNVVREYEPKLFNAANHIFGESYEYTRKYREFRKNMKEETK